MGRDVLGSYRYGAGTGLEAMGDGRDWVLHLSPCGSLVVGNN